MKTMQEVANEIARDMKQEQEMLRLPPEFKKNVKKVFMLTNRYERLHGDSWAEQ